MVGVKQNQSQGTHLEKNQLKILRHCLREYDQFLWSIDDDQMKEHKEMHGRNLSDNIKKILEKI